jgi:hypothetical protein
LEPNGGQAIRAPEEPSIDAPGKQLSPKIVFERAGLGTGRAEVVVPVVFVKPAPPLFQSNRLTPAVDPLADNPHVPPVAISDLEWLGHLYVRTETAKTRCFKGLRPDLDA